MNPGDKFTLLEDIGYDDLRSIHYENRDIDQILDHLDNENFKVTRIEPNRDREMDKIYYFNPYLDMNCFFRRWMTMLAEPKKVEPRGHQLTKIFRE